MNKDLTNIINKKRFTIPDGYDKQYVDIGRRGFKISLYALNGEILNEKHVLFADIQNIAKINDIIDISFTTLHNTGKNYCLTLHIHNPDDYELYLLLLEYYKQVKEERDKIIGL